MTVTHDFQVIISCDDTTGWQATDDGAISVNNTNYIEGSGALNLYKPGTSSQNFGMQYTFQNPIDLTDKLIVAYIYVTPDIKGVVKYFYLTLCDANGKCTTGRRDYNIAYYMWLPVYMHGYGTSIDWSQVKTLKIWGQTWSSSQTIPEGAIVVDRIMVGSGIYVVDVTDVNPHTLQDVAEVDAKDKLLFVEKIGQYSYMVRGMIRVGDGTNVGALKIANENVILDATQMTSFNEGVITVYANSFLILDNALILHSTTNTWPYGSAGINLLGNSIFRANNSYYITLLPLMTGNTYRHNMAVQEFTAENYFTNVMLWMYAPTVQNINWTGAMYLLPYASFIFDDYGARGKTIDTPLYLMPNAEAVPRNIGEASFTALVFAGGRLRTDASATAYVYNPFGLTPDNLQSSITGNGKTYVYYDVDIYVVDRYGNPVANGDVKIYNSQNDLAAEATTDEEGHVQVRLLTYYVYYDSNLGENVYINYNPFNVEVYVSGGYIGGDKIIVTGRQTFYIRPDDVYVLTTWPEKPSIQTDEPLNVYVEVKKIDGTPVSGLDAYVDITAPDGTTYTVSLSETQPGLYSGQFTETGLVGTYDMLGYAVIENVRVEGRNKFFVGRLERLINMLSAKLDAYRWTL